MPLLALQALRHWKFALAALLLLALGVQSYRLNSAHNRIESQRTEIAECRAGRDVVDAQLKAAEAESVRQRQAFQEAQRIGAETIRAAQRDALRVRQTPANGCPTPSIILEAGL